MLKSAIYFSSYFFILFILLRLCLNKKRRIGETLFLTGVSLIPIGKLFYIPTGSLASVKAAFIFTAIVGSFSLLISFIKGLERYVFLPFIFVIPALLSIVFLYAPSQMTFLAATGDTAAYGSVFLRIVSVFLSSVYCAYTIIYVKENQNSHRDIATHYIGATLFATLVGALIYYGLIAGQLHVSDLAPISPDEPQVSGTFWRFNPGANVNEFGQVVGYAILMLRWTGWRTSLKILVTAVLAVPEFLALTRGAWVGLIVAYFLYAFFTERKQRIRLFLAGALLVVVFFVLTLQSTFLAQLITSRISIAAGAGGEDRIRVATEILEAISASPMRLFFGYGWAADLFAPNYGFNEISYMHNVPLMMFFDTGLVGVAICFVTFVIIGKYIYANVKRDLDIHVALVAFMFTVSLFEHNFYHVQTWLIVGLVMGSALRSSKMNRTDYSSFELGQDPS